MRKSLLIWWLSEKDCKKIGEVHFRDDLMEDSPANDLTIFNMKGIVIADSLPWPEYIAREYISRYGRNGRGGLWIPQEISLTGIPWDTSNPITKRLEKCGGIVFFRKDLSKLKGYPGIVTDTNLNKVRR
ncbi:MAG: hypothetical protein ABH814_04050 [bacterium]